MDNHVRTVRTYKKTPTIQVPAMPDHISSFLSQSAQRSENSRASPPSIQSSPDGLLFTSSSTLLSPLGSPFSNASGSSSQPRLIRAPQDKTQKQEEKFKRMDEFLRNSGFDSIGEFLQILFYNPTCVAGKDPPARLRLPLPPISPPIAKFHKDIFRLIQENSRNELKNYLERRPHSVNHFLPVMQMSATKALSKLSPSLRRATSLVSNHPTLIY